jgi:hypothetical protein
MSRLAANSAASPSVSLRALQTANPGQTPRESGENSSSFLSGRGRSNGDAIAPEFCSQCTDKNFGSMCVRRYVSRLLLGHCFGAIPAPGGTAPLCFGFAALRVMVPP